MILNRAKNPSSEYRPIPFWSWNDKLEQEEIIRQILLMNQAGLGGFFMHARGGLQTEYLSSDWFDVIRTALKSGTENSMNPWAYDENGWPSGFGDGRVYELGLDYQQKYLRCKKVTPAETVSAEHVIACYDLNGQRLDSAQINTVSELLLLYFDVNPYYVDTLSREVTDKFIESVHQTYYNTLTEDERKKMRGFFTDEPQISRNGIPWSFGYEKEYRKVYDEELLNVLPHLFFPLQGYECTRWRFWRLTTHLFSENFLKPIYEWCEAHGWQLTGHLACEENYKEQLTCNGAVMPHYRYYHIPGMDALGRNLIPLANILQLTSAAAQLGKEQVVSETFALCGWAVDFADLKWLYQWQTVHGINLLCQHLEGYSLRGIRKRDYPASLFAHQPWWNDYKPFNDMVSRLGVLLSKGEIKTDILLLHGITTAHILFDTTPESQNLIAKYSDCFENLSCLLEGAHLSHHYGDETLMELYGSVTDGKLVVGKQQYRLILLPKLMNLSGKQVELLTAFIGQGGQVLGLKNDLDSSFYVDGKRTDDLPLLQNIQWYAEPEKLIEAATKIIEPVSAVRHGSKAEVCTTFAAQEQRLNTTRRYFADFDGKPAVLNYYINLERHIGFDADLYLDAQGVEEYNPETGELTSVFYEKRNHRIKVTHHFEPAGSLLLITRNYEVAPALPQVCGKALTLVPEFEISKITENLLTLDHCGYEVDGVKCSDHEYVLSIQDTLLKLKRNANVVLNFEFEIGATYPAKDLMMLLEHPEKYEITLNGIRISNRSRGYFADKAFERIFIAPAVVPGINKLQLRTTFHQAQKTYDGIEASKVFESERNKLSFDSEIEAVYLCGDFSVATDAPFHELKRNAVRCSGPFRLEASVKKVDIAHLEQAGLAFFVGEVTLTQKVELSPTEAAETKCLAFRHIYANIAKVRINAVEIGTISRPIFLLNIPSGCLKSGKNHVEITLINSLRNMLGPFHREEGELWGVAPWSFYKDTGVFGIQKASNWNDGYCFIRFGAVLENGLTSP